jgi:predicted amidohydrolase YtcJ
VQVASPTAYVNGRVITMDDALPYASELITEAGRVVAIGGDGLAENVADTVDLGGHTVIPGFVDAHCHLETFATHLTFAVQCFVPPHRSISDIGESLRQAAQKAAPGTWIVGRAEFSVHLFVAEQRHITRQDLDEAVPGHPVVVFAGLHYCTLNTAALRETGLLTKQAQLPRGSTIHLESGRGTELADWLPLPAYGTDQIAAAIERMAAERFRSRGVTTIAEMPSTRNGIAAYQSLRQNRKLPVRISMRYIVPRVRRPDEIAAIKPCKDVWLDHAGVKFFVDGAGADLDGALTEDLKWSQGELDRMVKAANDNGLQVMMHVQSERAGDMALTALSRALDSHPRADHRHRVEHLGDLPLGRDWWERVRALGVIPVATPQFIYSYGDWAQELNNPPLRTMRSMGLRVPGNSDSTGTQPEAANPFHGIWCAMARRTRNGARLSPDEAIDFDDALRMFTADAAYACHLDDRGCLAPGKLADFVVLGRDPRELDIDELPGTPIDFTVLGGKACLQ